MTSPIGIVALNLGGPDSPEAVEPFLRNLLGDPDVIQFGWLRFIQPIFAKRIAKRRAPYTTSLYNQIGRWSPIREESQAQVEAVVQDLAHRGIAAKAYVAMGCWHPFSEEAVAQIQRDGVQRVVLMPLYPHLSRTTTGSSFKAFDKAAKGKGLHLQRITSYPTHPGYIDAVAATIAEAEASIPPELRGRAPVLFSAHGLPEKYVQRGDPYLAEIQATVAAVSKQLELGNRQRLSFQSRLGRARWLSPSTEDMLATLAKEGHKALVLCPISFTGEHIETLHECDILYREACQQLGISIFARARTVGSDPRYIAALADLCQTAISAAGWATAPA
jgi:ferrochelatase